MLLFLNLLRDAKLYSTAWDWVLIVDEIQHLSIAKSQGEEVMLNFLLL